MIDQASLEIVQAHGKKFYRRIDISQDRHVLFNESHYNRLVKEGWVQPGDRWLDVGANIGAFSVRFADQVESIHAYEPDVDNQLMLGMNLELNGIENVRRHRAAVVGGSTGTYEFAVGRSPLQHRIGRVRGREHVNVVGVNVNEAVSVGSCNKVKMDCEGCEKDAIPVMDFDPIQFFTFEWHFPENKDGDWVLYFQMLDLLRDRGFEVHAPTKKSGRWNANIYCVKR